MYKFLSINGIYLLFNMPLITATFIVFSYILKTKKWFKSDIGFVVFPGILYWAMESFRIYKYLGYSKTLANLVFELECLAAISFVLFLVRSLLGKYYLSRAKNISYLSLVIILVVTILIFIFTPPMQE